MSEAGTLRVLIADDHSPMRLGLAAIISMVPGAQCVGQAVDGEDAVEQYLALRPDLMTLDLRMPGLDGLEVIQRVVAAAPEAKILVVTMHDRQDDIVRSLRAGARGYVLKSAPAREIEDAIVTVARGLRYTPPYVADQLAGDQAKVGVGADEHIFEAADVTDIIGLGDAALLADGDAEF